MSIPARAQRMHRMDYIPARVYYNARPNEHWFDDDTLRFFRTRLGNWNRTPSGDIAFITSEQPPHAPRAYTLRILHHRKGCNISNVGGFCTLTRSQARSFLIALTSGQNVSHWTK